MHVCRTCGKARFVNGLFTLAAYGFPGPQNGAIMSGPSLRLQTASLYVSSYTAAFGGSGGPFGYSPDTGEFAGVITSAGLAQEPFDDTDRFDEIAPIDRRQRAQASDTVADRHLVSGLLLRLELHQVLDGMAGFEQPVFDPGQRQGQRRALSEQASGELGDEGAAHR